MTCTNDGYYLNRFIGKGLTAQVFTLHKLDDPLEIETDDYVAKKFHHFKPFQQELKIVKDIKKSLLNIFLNKNYY